MDVDAIVGWVFVGWMLVVMVCAPLAWAWLMLAERKDRRRTAAEDQAIALANSGAVTRHPAKRKHRGPEDDPRFMDWLNNRKDT